MEHGAKSLLIILCIALVMGAVVVGVKDSYRNAFLAMWRGTPAESPIWQDNAAYYPDIQLPAPPPAESADPSGDAR